MLLTYRYKLMPTKPQYAALARMLAAQRHIYNAALQERRDAWRKAKVSISRMDQTKSLTKIRADDETYRSFPVAMSRWPLARVDDAMKGFFRRVQSGEKPGYPRFKSLKRWHSFGFSEWKGISLEKNRLVFKPLVGGLRINMHRPLPEGQTPKSCVFTRKGRHWWVCFAVKVEAAAGHKAPESAIGIDVGVLHLATTSNGEFFLNARPRAKRAKALLERRVAEHRATHLHQVAAGLARRHAHIIVEDLNLRNMTRSARGNADEPGKNVRAKAGLNRAMLDASPGRLIELLIYKAERAGGRVMKIDPRGTSQDCSSCGAKVEKTLSVRTHRCACGAELDRDVNAALNILERGLSARGRAEAPGDANVGRRPKRRPGNAVPARVKPPTVPRVGESTSNAG